jgi:hypothetical protein
MVSHCEQIALAMCGGRLLNYLLDTQPVHKSQKDCSFANANSRQSNLVGCSIK